MKPQNVAPCLGGVLLKTRHSTSTIFEIATFGITTTSHSNHNNSITFVATVTETTMTQVQDLL